MSDTPDAPDAPKAPGAQLLCARHNTPTRLTCAECEIPICPKCGIKTQVGFKCPEHAWIEPPRRRRSRKVVALLVVAGAVGAFVVLRDVGQEEPFTATCPTRSAPDVGLGNTARGTNWKEMDRSPICGRFRASAVWSGKELLVWGGQNCAGAECPGDSAPRLADGGAYDPARNRWHQMAASSIAGRDAAMTVWTGKEMVVWGGTDFGAFLGDGAAYDPEADRWRTISPSPLTPRADAVAEWSGTEMIVWGGALNADGAAYDPAKDTWRPLPEAPIGGRSAAASAWTGRELLVWGGSGGGQVGPLADGAAYDPASNTWRRLPAVGLAPRKSAAAVWTGQELIVWGGDAFTPNIYGDGAAYNPASNTWRALPGAPISPRGVVLAVWSGREMMIWGGLGPAGSEGAAPALSGGGPRGRPFDPNAIVPLGDGAAYNPSGNRWRRLPRVELLERGYPLGVWDGSGMIVWGGLVIVDSPASAADGARYTP